MSHAKAFLNVGDGRMMAILCHLWKIFDEQGPGLPGGMRVSCEVRLTFISRSVTSSVSASSPSPIE